MAADNGGPCETEGPEPGPHLPLPPRQRSTLQAVKNLECNREELLGVEGSGRSARDYLRSCNFRASPYPRHEALSS